MLTNHARNAKPHFLIEEASTGLWMNVFENVESAKYNDEVRRMRLTGYAAHMAEKRNAYRALVGKPEGRGSPLGTRHRWNDNIEMDLREI
jgi:hypothetical protein